MPEGQSVLLAIRDGMTVEELLVTACTKGQLSTNDYFLRFQASLDSPEYYVAPRTELLDNLVKLKEFQYIHKCFSCSNEEILVFHRFIEIYFFLFLLFFLLFFLSFHQRSCSRRWRSVQRFFIRLSYREHRWTSCSASQSKLNCRKTATIRTNCVSTSPG